LAFSLALFFLAVSPWLIGFRRFTIRCGEESVSCSTAFLLCSWFISYFINADFSK